MNASELRARILRTLRSAGGAWLALAILLAVCALTSAPFRNPRNLLNIVLVFSGETTHDDYAKSEIRADYCFEDLSGLTVALEADNA